MNHTGYDYWVWVIAKLLFQRTDERQVRRRAVTTQKEARPVALELNGARWYATRAALDWNLGNLAWHRVIGLTRIVPNYSVFKGGIIRSNRLALLGRNRKNAEHGQYPASRCFGTQT